jgi:hypothetical protein
MANPIYGSMAAVLVVLLTLEAAAVILLLDSQVIAEIDRPRSRAVPEGCRRGLLPETQFPDTIERWS